VFAQCWEVVVFPSIFVEAACCEKKIFGRNFAGNVDSKHLCGKLWNTWMILEASAEIEVRARWSVFDATSGGFSKLLCEAQLVPDKECSPGATLPKHARQFSNPIRTRRNILSLRSEA
jgi:hypothetical protein